MNLLSAKTFIKAEIIQGWQDTYSQELRNHLGKDVPLVEKLTSNTVDSLDLQTHGGIAREPFSPSSRPDPIPLKPELKTLRKETSERVVGPVENLSRHIDMEMRKPEYQEIGFDQARYKVFIESVPPSLRVKVEEDPRYESNIRNILNLYGFQFAETDPVKGPLQKASQSVFVVPRNQPEGMLGALNLAHGGVGEYGADLQRKLAQTTAILLDLAQSPEFT